MVAESAYLEFKDWIEVALKDEASVPIPLEESVLTFADGSRRKGS
jgi:hypothetical protein